MGNDGDCFDMAKVYVSRKERKRQVAKNSDSESDGFVVAVQEGNDATSGRMNMALEMGVGRRKRLTRGDANKKNLSSEKCKGMIMEFMPDKKTSEMDIAMEKHLEPNSGRKRKWGTNDGDVSGKKPKIENVNSIDRESEKSGEDDMIVVNCKNDVHSSKLPVLVDKHRDQDADSNERKFQPCLKENCEAEFVNLLGRYGQCELLTVRDAEHCDTGIAKEVENGRSLRHRYIRNQDKNGNLKILKNSKEAGLENANGQNNGLREKGRLKPTGTINFSVSNHQLKGEPDKKLTSNVKIQKGAGKPFSEDASRFNTSKVNEEIKIKKKGRPRKNAAVLVGKAKKKTTGSNEMRSVVKNKLRDQIKNILFDAGWKIEFRPRRGRDYEDAVYVSPQGSGYWSITKAYDIYLKTQIASDNKECIGKQYEASTGKDNEGKEAMAISTFAVIPPEVLHILKKKIVNKRRSKQELEDVKPKVGCGRKKKSHKEITKVKYPKDKGTRANVGGTRTMKKEVMVRNSKKKGCTLLVRGLNEDEGSDNSDYVPYAWKRTIISWMIDLGVIPAYGKVRYMSKRMTRTLLDGRITRDGIQCSCCSKVLSASKFEIHAGGKLNQPYENIYLEASGISLLQCQINAWEKHQTKSNVLKDLKIEGDDPNDDTCAICADGGDLICCDSCPSTFHLGCLGMKVLPAGDWHCSNCSCKFCGLVHDSVIQDGNCSNILLTCSQCTQKYHKNCVPDDDSVSTAPNNSCNVFCGRSCRKVFKKLQKLIGIRNGLGAGFFWSIVRQFEDPSKSLFRMAHTVESNSKIAVAYDVMDECFLPIIDLRSGINLIHNVVYNCGSNFNRLNFSGFYTFILEKSDEIVAAASVRIHDTRLAEMPFIGTRCIYRRQGMCRRLLQGIETALRSLGVRKFVIPAISELIDTWTNAFGFKPLEMPDNEEIKIMNILVFPGTGLLQKSLFNVSNKKHANPELESQSPTLICGKEENNTQPNGAMDIKESKCSEEAIKLDIPVMEHSTGLLPEKSGSHANICKDSDSAAKPELSDVKRVASGNNHDVKVACNEEPKNEFEDVIIALPSFQHRTSGIEASELRVHNHVNYEFPVKNVVKDCKSEKEGVERFVINEVKVSQGLNGQTSNVTKEDSTRHLNTSPMKGYASSGVCSNGLGSIPLHYSVVSDENNGLEKSEFFQNQPKCSAEANHSAPLDQLAVNDSAGNLEKDLGSLEPSCGFDLSFVNQASNLVK